MALLNNAIPFTLIVWGQTHIASGVASILNASTPLFTVLLAHVLTRDERLTPGRIAGVLIGFCGVAVMMGGAALGGVGVGVAAQAACLVAAVSYACRQPVGPPVPRPRVPPLATATAQLTASSLMLGPLALLVDRPWALPAPGAAVLASLVGRRGALDRAGLHDLLSAPRPGGRHEPQPRHVPDPGQRDPARRRDPRRDAAAAAPAGMALIGLGLAAIDGRAVDRLRRLPLIASAHSDGNGGRFPAESSRFRRRSPPFQAMARARRPAVASRRTAASRRAPRRYGRRRPAGHLAARGVKPDSRISSPGLAPSARRASVATKTAT